MPLLAQEKIFPREQANSVHWVIGTASKDVGGARQTSLLLREKGMAFEHFSWGSFINRKEEGGGRRNDPNEANETGITTMVSLFLPL